METVRSFIGIDLNEHIRQKFQEIQNDFKEFYKFSSVKYVDPAIIHITLKFLGNISLEEVGKVAKGLGTVHFSRFPITFKGLGVFPNKRRLRVIWVGIEDPDKLIDLQHAITLTLNKKFSEEKKFEPHVTIARIKQHYPEETSLILEKVNALSNRDVGEFTVGSFQLKKSTLTPKGPIYETIEEVKL